MRAKNLWWTRRANTFSWPRWQEGCTSCWNSSLDLHTLFTIHSRRDQSLPVSEANTLYEDIHPAKNVALHASYVKLFALPKLSPSKPKSEKTAAEGPLVTISTWPSASTVVSAKRVAPSMPSLNRRMLNMPPKPEKSFYTTRRSYWQMEINGNRNWQPQQELMRRTDKSVSFVDLLYIPEWFIIKIKAYSERYSYFKITDNLFLCTLICWFFLWIRSTVLIWIEAHRLLFKKDFIR